MNVQGIKKLVIIVAVLGILLVGFKELYFDKQVKGNKVDVSVDNNDKDQLDDVVKTIVEMNYQPITSIDKESTDKGYVVINLSEENLKNNINKILDLAKKTDIKLTFVDKNKVFQKNNGYLNTIEKEGHTIIPSYIDLKDIFSKNNIEILKNDSNLKDLSQRDAAFIVNDDNINDKLIDNMEEVIKKLQNNGYHFKAFV